MKSRTGYVNWESEKFIAVTTTYVRSKGSPNSAPGRDRNALCLAISSLLCELYTVVQLGLRCPEPGWTLGQLPAGWPDFEKMGSRPVSRVLSRAIIPLGSVSPRTSSGLPGSARGAALPPHDLLRA